jgi:hypothetical protein
MFGVGDEVWTFSVVPWFAFGGCRLPREGLYWEQACQQLSLSVASGVFASFGPNQGGDGRA